MPARYVIDQLIGNDANDGSESTPWKTSGIIETKSNLAFFNAGDIVDMKPYTYTKKLGINQSGSAGAPIWVRGDPRYAAKPVIQSDSVYGLLFTGAFSYQRFSGIEIIAPTGGGNDSVFSNGTGTDLTLEDLYVHDPVATFCCLHFASSNPNVIVRGCKLTNSSQDGIDIHVGCTNFLVEWCWIENHGTTAYGGTPGDGVSFHGPCTGIVRNNYIRRCSKFGVTNIQDSGALVEIYNNFISDCVLGGISCDWAGGITTMGNHRIYNNVVLMADTRALIGIPFGIYFAGDTSLASLGIIELYGNTVINAVNDSGVFCVGSSFEQSSPLRVLMSNNNLVPISAGALLRVSNVSVWNAQGSVFRNNNYYQGASGGRFRWAPTGLGTSTTGAFAAYKTAMGGAQETGSVTVDPLMVNQAALVDPGVYSWINDTNRWSNARGAADVFLKSGSTLRGAGIALGGLAPNDNRGRKRRVTPDIGAFEYFEMMPDVAGARF